MFYQNKGLKTNKLGTDFLPSASRISSKFCIFHRKSQYDLHACDFLGWKIHYLHQAASYKNLSQLFPHQFQVELFTDEIYFTTSIKKKSMCLQTSEAVGITPHCSNLTMEKSVLRTEQDSCDPPPCDMVVWH